MEQNKDNYPEINNAPANPYTKDYREYIADPDANKDQISRPKRLTSMILCAVSSVWILLTCSYWGTTYAIDNVTSYAAAMIFFWLFCFMLVPSIIAKVFNSKSKWAVINLICTGVVFVVIIVMSIFMPPW